jgi:nucleotidyltransferase/DNA polymerase involved in DNA repair
VSRCVLYAEVPGFYAQVERAQRPELAGRPVIVGGNPRKGGLVQAATADAAAAGVVAGMPVLEALERCPNARALPTDMRCYRELGVRLFACLRAVCERIEESGLGAAYADLAEGAEAEAIARELRRRVDEQLGLTLRVGIGPGKFVARLAAQAAGEQGVRRVTPAEVRAFLDPLPVTRLDGVGANTQAALAKRDVRTIGQLVALGPARLEEILGNRGLELLALATGREPSPVRATRHAKSLSQETTLPAPQVDAGVLSERIQSLAEALERRLALESLCARRVSLKLRFEDHETATRSHTLAGPVSDAREIHSTGLALLRRTQAGVRPVRLVGLAVSELEVSRGEGPQLDLFPPRR